MRTRSTFLILLASALATALDPYGSSAQTATGISAFHRSGQTFLTWTERSDVDNEFYVVYRHSEAITAATLSSATRVARIPDSSGMYLTERWKEDYQIPVLQRNFIIHDRGSELPDGTGLFVFTTAAGEQGSAWYAVTSIVGGVENTTLVSGANALASPVSETVAEPLPVIAKEWTGGRGRVYTQFMDFRAWNPSYDGYAYNYFVSVPATYDAQIAWPLYLQIQGWGSRYSWDDSTTGTPYDGQAIMVWCDEPHQSWYYGYAATHNYGDTWPQYVWGDLDPPTAGVIANFTEQRILRAIRDVERDGFYNVDTNRITAFGHSMGGSGALALGMRYPNVFAAVSCSEPMTNYRGDNPQVGGDWIRDVSLKIGDPALNLPIRNDGPFAAHLAAYNNLGVWYWMNHQVNMIDRMGDEMAYIHTLHGRLDDVIEWDTQGAVWYSVLPTQAKRGWQGATYPIDHTWAGFLPTPNFTFEAYSFRKDRSFPAFTNFSLNHGSSDHEWYYNVGIEWSCPWNDFLGDITDRPGEYAIALRLYDPALPDFESIASSGTVDITPRRLQAFRTPPGSVWQWSNRQVPDEGEVQSGTVTADAHGLITIPGFRVTKTGNRLLIGRSTAVAVPQDNGFVLHPNFPNPFSSYTVLSFELQAEADVELSVLNMQGRRVARLLSGTLGTGAHSALFDPRSLPAASYIAALRVTDSAGRTTVQHRLMTSIR